MTSETKDVDKMTVAQLKEQLKKLSLKTNGNKPELQERLKSSVSKKKSSPKASSKEHTLPPNVLENIMQHVNLKTAANLSMVDKRHHTVLQSDLKKHPEYKVRLNLEPTTDYKKPFLTPNGKKLITTGYYNMKIWDTQTGELLHTFTLPETQEFITLSYGGSLISSNGKILAHCVKNRINRFSNVNDRMLELWLWNLEDYSLIRKVNIGNDIYDPNLLVFSPDSKTLVISERGRREDFKISFINVSTGTIDHQLVIKSNVLDMAFSPSGRFLALFEETIQVIDMVNMRLHYEISPPPYSQRRRTEPPFHIRMKFVPKHDILVVATSNLKLSAQTIKAHDLVNKTVLYTLEDNTRLTNGDLNHGDLFDVSTDGILATIHKDNVSIELHNAMTGELTTIIKPQVFEKKVVDICSILFNPNNPDILVYSDRDIKWGGFKEPRTITLYDIKKQEIIRQIVLKEVWDIEKLQGSDNLLMALTTRAIYIWPYLFQKLTLR